MWANVSLPITNILAETQPMGWKQDSFSLHKWGDSSGWSKKDKRGLGWVDPLPLLHLTFLHFTYWTSRLGYKSLDFS